MSTNAFTNTSANAEQVSQALSDVGIPSESINNAHEGVASGDLKSCTEEDACDYASLPPIAPPTTWKVNMNTYEPDHTSPDNTVWRCPVPCSRTPPDAELEGLEARSRKRQRTVGPGEASSSQAVPQRGSREEKWKIEAEDLESSAYNRLTTEASERHPDPGSSENTVQTFHDEDDSAEEGNAEAMILGKDVGAQDVFPGAISRAEDMDVLPED
ncbi:hypothetical protein FA95DRAFT_1610540, partial [Auriscalpium vulgare]